MTGPRGTARDGSGSMRGAGSARRRRTGVAGCLAVLTLLLTACGTALGGGGTAVAAGARLENAVFLEDPHSYVGPSSARLAETGIDPVADDPGRRARLRPRGE